MQRIVTQLVSGCYLKIKSGGFPLDFICFKIDFQSYFSSLVHSTFCVCTSRFLTFCQITEQNRAKLLNELMPNY